MGPARRGRHLDLAPDGGGDRQDRRGIHRSDWGHRTGRRRSSRRPVQRPGSPPTNQVNLLNNGSSAFTLQAPYSNILMAPSNNSVFKGAIVGYTVTLGQASHFTYEADTGPIQNNALTVYYRAFYEQCPAQPSSAGDPTSGC